MHRLWNPILEPLLDRLAPRVVVEVGSAAGDNTRNLVEFCTRTGAVLHSIDPLPGFDIDEWKGTYGDAFVPHRSTSLEALPLIADPDVVLIDGDHNWYTVYHELQALLDRRADGGFPVVFLHDVGWPYGRRDQYYEPSRIPESYRQPYGSGALSPSHDDFDPDGGFNATLNHSRAAGGPRNGVLTAVEDFLADHGELRWLVIPGVHDLGIITPEGLSKSHPAAAAILDEFDQAPTAVRALASLEALRIQESVLAAGRRHQLSELTSYFSTTESHAKSLNAQIRSLRSEIETLRRTADRADRALADLRTAQGRLADLRSRRSVRIALGLTSLVRPIFGLARRVKNLPRRVRERRAAPTKPRTQHVDPTAISSTASADIVLCVHNAPEAVTACLESLASGTDLSDNRLIIIDDGSGAETRDLLVDFAAAHPATLIRNEGAQGYTRAANQGLRVSTAPFVVLLNSDTVVPPGWLDRLIRCATVDPTTAVVSAYSNAASWQSIPDHVNSEGSWAVNQLPDGMTVADVDAVIQSWSPRLHPEVPLLNGFCYLISREAIERVGLLDEETFPRGFGEEDDYSLRCAEVGLGLRLADDCYVYHAKSQSFTPEGRNALAAEMGVALRTKYGKDRIRDAVKRMQNAEGRVRSQTFVSMALRAATSPVTPPALTGSPRVGWIQPHLKPAGGIRRAIEMTNRLSQWGWQPVLIGWDSTATSWLPILADVVDIDTARSMDFDILMVSDPDMVWPFLELDASLKVNFHLAPCMLYREANDDLTAYYDKTREGVLHLANSNWLAGLVTEHAGVTIEGVFPGGVDKRLFHPRHHDRRADVVYAASPREHKGIATIEEACQGLSTSVIKGIDGQQELAALLNSGRVYVSAAWHEGFNMSALEAMACGVPVVMTDDGGSRDYAIHEENALVVPPRDPQALRGAIDRLLADEELRARVITGGIRAAWAFDWDRVTADFARLLESQVSRRR